MDFKATSIERGAARAAGFAVAEVMVTIGVAAILFLAVCAFSVFAGRSFAAMFNYVDLDDANRVAMDRITRDLRQCNRVTSYTTNALTIEDSDLGAISYTYNTTDHTLTRVKGADRRVLLSDCDTLSFTLGQRNAVGGTYDIYPSATVTNAKVVNVSWLCSRTIFGRKENTESVQTARIVIRKQG